MVTSFLFFFKHKNKMQYFGLVLLAGAVSEAPLTVYKFVTYL